MLMSAVQVRHRPLGKDKPFPLTRKNTLTGVALVGKCTSGGIGRRAGFRFRCLTTWGFKSLLAHYFFNRINTMSDDENTELDPEARALMEDKIKELLEGDTGIQFNGSLPGSLASQTDIQYGDLLVSVNDKPIRNVKDYSSASLLDKESRKLTFVRKGTNRMFEVYIDFKNNKVEQTFVI